MRLRCLLYALVILLLSPGASAQLPTSSWGKADLKTVTVRTWPPGARITLELPQAQAIAPVSGEGAPVSGEPMYYNATALTQASTFTLGFELPGYHKRQIVLPSFSFNSRTEYPQADQPAIRLDPKYPVVVDLYYFLKLNPLVAVALVLAGAGFVFFVLPRRAAKRKQERDIVDRATRIEQLTARADMTDPLIKTSLGGYRILDKLGSGGMAAVYYAVPDESLDTGEAVALKVIHWDYARDPEFMQRFNHEVRVGVELKHPGIVAVYSFGDQDGMPWMALEYVKGEPLRNRVLPGGLPLAKAMAILKPVMQAVDYAHSRGIIHRDLKPDNVMITADDQVKVMDFGLARRHDFSKVTATGTSLGTPAYMPPEQIMGQRENIDHRADQYALGILAYELICGRTPYEDDDPMSIIYKHLTLNPTPPGQLRTDLPARAEAVILKMISKDANDRYPTVAEALKALEEALQPSTTNRMPSA